MNDLPDPGDSVRFRLVVADTCVTACGRFVRDEGDTALVFDGSVVYRIPIRDLIFDDLAPKEEP